MEEWKADWLGADMKTYERAPAFLENPRLYEDYGQLLADVLYGAYNLDLTPRKKLITIARRALKSAGLRTTTVVRDALAALRAL